ncbi:MAG: carbohydrate ABC transporter permease [Massiliimalia sp.]
MAAIGGTKKIKAIHVWPYLFCLPFIVSYLAFNLFPTLYSLVLSFFKWNGVGEKTFVGISNYVQLWTKDPLFLKSIGNTIILMAFGTPITVFLGLLVAYLLFDVGRGRRIYQTINFFPYITTPVAIGFIFSYLFDWQAGYVNKVLVALGIFDEPFYWLQSPAAVRAIVVIMVVWRYLGYYMTIYLASMTSVPAEVYEAAKVDGARSITIFFRITVPLLKNISVFLVITSLIGGLQMFEEPLLLFSGWAAQGGVSAGGPDNVVLTTVWKFYNDAFKLDSQLGYGSAIAYSLFVVIMLFSIISFKVSQGRNGGDE